MQNSSIPDSIKCKYLALEILDNILSIIPDDENLLARTGIKKLKVDMMYYAPEIFDKYYWNDLYMICHSYINDPNKPYTNKVFNLYTENLNKYYSKGNTFQKEYKKIMEMEREKSP